MRVSTAEAIKGSEEIVLAHFGLPEITGNRHFAGGCPLCGKRRKFRLNRFNGSVNYICVCGAGSVIKLIMESTGRDYKSTCNEIDIIIGNEFKPEPRQQNHQQVKERLLKKEVLMNRFAAIHTLKNSQTEFYLKSRGIIELPQMSVKHSNSEFDKAYKRSFSCMYAIATDESMNIVYTHKTYLENGKKADVQVNKKMETVNKYNEPCPTCQHEHAANVAVRMFEHGETLGISEGIESGLSAKQLFGFPVWCVLNTSIMKEFKAPRGVTRLIVYADNDINGAGLAAAMVCAHKNLLANNDVKKVVVRMPSKKDSDFNDMLQEPMDTIDIELG